MANPSPRTENLASGRGKRKKLNNPTVAMRMSPVVRAELEAIAKAYGCIYGGKPWIAGLLEKIGLGELLVVPAPPTSFEQDEVVDPKEMVKQRVSSKFCPTPLKDGEINS